MAKRGTAAGPPKLSRLGVLELQKGNAAAAAELLAGAIAQDPSDAAAHANLGSALRALGRREEALASFERALLIRPQFAEAHFNRGNVLHDLKRTAEALESYERALALNPSLVQAHVNRGNALRELGRADEALQAYDRALVLRPTFARALYIRARLLRELDQPERALADYDRVLALDPRNVDALVNRGSALHDLDRYEEELACLARAQALAPELASPRMREGQCRLRMGDFERGWEQYEWRWKVDPPPPRPRLAAPRWDGRPFEGTLLAWGEQGVGDQILYLGMLGDLAARAGRLIVALEPRLLPLARRSFPQVSAVPLDRSIEALRVDAEIPLGSVGRYLRRGWSDFPCGATAGYLAFDAQRAAALRARLAADGDFVCGLSWISKNERLGRHKSIALADLRPILALPGIRFVDLQYGDTSVERAALEPALRERLVRIEDVDNFGDLDGLAALIGACDAVVTVSNTTAHLAGALGKPTLVLLPYSRGRLWYWHDGREDSPWYPDLRLCMQPARGDWRSVLDAVQRSIESRTMAR